MISIALNFNLPSFHSFLTHTIVAGLVLFIILLLSSKLVQYKQEGDKKKVFRFGGLLAVFLIFSLFGYSAFITGTSQLGCLHTPPHFGTNQLTGRCEFLYPTPCHRDPWYYKPGCNLSTSKLTQVLKASKHYRDEIKRCNYFCNYNMTKRFCREKIRIRKFQFANKVRCGHLVRCENITCS